MSNSSPTFRSLAIRSVIPLTFVTLSIPGCATLPIALQDTRDHLVPIEVALEPDPALDNQANTGKTHIALVRHFVRGRDLHHVSSVVAYVMSTTKLESLSLRATGYRTANWNGVTGTAMAIEPSQDLRRLADRLVENLHIFSEDPTTAEDFIVTTDGQSMRGSAIDAVRRFVPDFSGVNFRPHAMLSAAQTGNAKQLESQAFTPFAFKAASAAVYQLDREGVAQRALWVWTGEPGARRP
jgi:hypothetical protein